MKISVKPPSGKSIPAPLVLPIFGPSSPRDGVGLLADTLIDPFTC